MNDTESEAVTLDTLHAMKQRGEKIACLTAYDASFTRVLEDAGVDMFIIGDSLGMVLMGYDSTVPVTMDEMVHHAKAVSFGVERAVLIGDMPFMSYQVSREETMRNAGRFMKEGNCDAVKLEGGLEVCDTVSALVKAGIPVVGHIGLTPQSSHVMGGFKTQGRDEDTWSFHEADAKAVSEAGAFSMVLEGMVEPLAAKITKEVEIPTIGIGASVECDGQILVLEDMLGLNPRPPKFVKVYGDLLNQIEGAVAAYAEDVKARKFPTEDEVYR